MLNVCTSVFVFCGWHCHCVEFVLLLRHVDVVVDIKSENVFAFKTQSIVSAIASCMVSRCFKYNDYVYYVEIPMLSFVAFVILQLQLVLF